MTEEKESRELENNILGSFANVAETIGYSPLHGKIIGVLILKGAPVSLNELAKRTGYSASMISLSLDFLEVMEVIKKVKKAGDRKLYVELNGDLLTILKKAIVVRVKKTIATSFSEFEQSKRKVSELENGDKKRLSRAIETLEEELKRLDHYIGLLSEIDLP